MSWSSNVLTGWSGEGVGARGAVEVTEWPVGRVVSIVWRAPGGPVIGVAEALLRGQSRRMSRTATSMC